MAATIGLSACRRAVRGPLPAIAMLAWSTVVVDADEPPVRFDVEYSVECHEVTPEPFAAVYPDEKIIEMTMSSAVWVAAGGEDDLRQLTIAVTSPERRLRVADYSPRTELESAVTGEIAVVRSSESIRSLGATLGGNFAAPHGWIAAQAAPSGNATATARDELKESSQRIPAKTAVLISGMIDGGHGVLYKFKPSVQDSLEGTKQFTVRFIVPRDWRGDWIHVACRAVARDRQVIWEKLVEAGRADFTVGLYMAGDHEVKQAALSLARAQGDYRSAGDVAPSHVERLSHWVSQTGRRIGTSSRRVVPTPLADVAQDVGLLDEEDLEASPPPLSPGERLEEARDQMRRFAAGPLDARQVSLTFTPVGY